MTSWFREIFRPPGASAPAMYFAGMKWGWGPDKTVDEGLADMIVRIQKLEDEIERLKAKK